jgi:4'-phosphopantetheinyl transferase
MPFALPAAAVARIDSLGALEAAVELLQARDRARLAVIASGKRRRELLAGRLLLSRLARHLRLPPVVFDGAEGAAGVVAWSGIKGIGALSASVSHSGGWVACAIGGEQGVGIDLETLSGRDFLALAEASFPESVAELEALPAEERKVAFYRRWTRHEAVIKRGSTRGRQTSWLQDGEWVLSLDMPADVGHVPEPVLWDDRIGSFRRLDLEALDRSSRFPGE